jgi:hypothetical protein
MGVYEFLDYCLWRRRRRTRNRNTGIEINFLSLINNNSPSFFLTLKFNIMQTAKSVLLIMFIALFVGCSNDDNGKSNLQLLTSGKWYNESKSPGTYTDCEKKGYIQFMTNGDVVIESFEDGITCASLGAVMATYILTNDVNLEVTLGTEMESAVIQSISETELTLSSNGEILVFDKTQG